MVIAVSPSQDGLHVACGTDVPVGCTLVYSYASVDGCSYAVYDANGKCIEEHVYASSSDEGVRGGGFTIDANMSYIKFSDNTTLYKAFDISVADFINGIGSVDALHAAFDAYSIDELYRQDIINIYLDNKVPGALSAYPVGSIYLATVDTDPTMLLGGAWQKLTGIFHNSVFAWTRISNVDMHAVCGTFLCGEALCGQ